MSKDPSIQETKVSTITLNDQGIIEIFIKPSVVQSMNDAIGNIEICKQIKKGKTRPMLLDLSRAEPVSPEIRRYYAGAEVVGHFSAIALLVQASSFGRTLGNFYLNVARKGVEKKLFNDKQKAMQWLEQFCD